MIGTSIITHILAIVVINSMALVIVAFTCLAMLIIIQIIVRIANILVSISTTLKINLNTARAAIMKTSMLIMGSVLPSPLPTA